MFFIMNFVVKLKYNIAENTFHHSHRSSGKQKLGTFNILRVKKDMEHKLYHDTSIILLAKSRNGGNRGK